MNPEGDLLHLRYKPKADNFKDCVECPAFDLFDWVIWSPDDKRFQRIRKMRPQKVLCLAHPSSLKTLLALKFLLSEITLVIAGEDTNLSSVLDLVERLVPHCRKVLFEAKDIEHPMISSFSMGYISYYLKRFGDSQLRCQHDLVCSPSFEKKGVLVAWGAIWSHLDHELEDRRRAKEFVERSDWLVREDLKPEEYLKRLAASKYLLAPAGQGVQAPKLAEAWLMRTVPICVRNPCFEDLSRQGLPILLLDSWEQMTPQLIAAFESDRLLIDWASVYQMLSLRYFEEMVLRS